MDPDDEQPQDSPEPDSRADEPAPAPAETTGPIDRETLAPAPSAPAAPPKFGTDRMWSDPARDYAAGPLPLEHEGFTRNIETGVLTGARWVDRLQSRVGPVAFVYAVFKKYFDDEGSRLAALMAYYTFISLIPLAVGCLAILAQVLRDRPGAVENVVADVVPHGYQDQVLAAYNALPTSGVALWVALVGLLLSGTAGVFSLYAAVNQIFAVPYRHRYGFGPRYARVFVVVFIMASAVLVVGVGSSVVGSLFEVPGANRLLVLFGSVALFSTAFYWSVKTLSRRVLRAHELLLGCILAGLVVTGFASLGSMLIGRFSASSTPVYGALASVIAVLSVMLLAANGLVMSLEISVVRAWQLWPRGIDIHLLYPADERAYVLLSVMDERMPSQRNDVRFDADGHFDPRRLPFEELNHRQPGVPRTPYDPDPRRHHSSDASDAS